jgi:hypothetical protein
MALACVPPAVAQVDSTNGVGTQFELTFWQSVAGSDDPTLYEAYLSRYPEGTFSPLARAKIAALRKTAAPQPVPPVAPVAPVAPPRAIPVPQTTPVGIPATTAPAEAPRFAAPAPVAASPAPAVAPVEVATAPVAPAPSAATRPAVADASNQPSTLGALLAALAHTQESPASVPTASAPATYATPVPAPLVTPPASAVTMPQRPQLGAVPPVSVPASFCSAEARNAFHDTSYLPAVAAAKRNNDAAIAYMKQIQATYDSYQLSGDSTTMNQLATEARAWQPVAADAYAVQAGLVRQFDALMAVPIVPCGAMK